ncbi:MAG: hypothetical protein ACYDCK_01460 [Thermoplasmatota archaeon]
MGAPVPVASTQNPPDSANSSQIPPVRDWEKEARMFATALLGRDAEIRALRAGIDAARALHVAAAGERFDATVSEALALARAGAAPK